MFLRKQRLANAWCRKLEDEDEEMKEEEKEKEEEEEQEKEKDEEEDEDEEEDKEDGRGRGRRGEERWGEGGGGGGESVENLVRGDSFKAKAEAKPKQSKIHKTRRQAGGLGVEQNLVVKWCFLNCFFCWTAVTGNIMAPNPPHPPPIADL